MDEIDEDSDELKNVQINKAQTLQTLQHHDRMNSNNTVVAKIDTKNLLDKIDKSEEAESAIDFIGKKI